MSNKNLKYRRGTDKEVRIVNNAKACGLIAFRSAGSHSPIDVCTIDATNKQIIIMQVKSCKKLRGKIEPAMKEKLEKEFSYLNGTYSVIFRAC